MAIREAVHLQNDGADADEVRRWMAAVAQHAEGIIPTAFDSLKVVQKGTPDMSVDVGAGACIIQGDENAFQGSYFCENDATVNLTVAAADPTDPRKDLVVAQIEDAFYSGAINAWKLAVVTGTPDPSPSAPAIPTSAIQLALLDVSAADTSIVTGDITDSRLSQLLDFASMTRRYGKWKAAGSQAVVTATKTQIAFATISEDNYGMEDDANSKDFGVLGLFAVTGHIDFVAEPTSGLIILEIDIAGADHTYINAFPGGTGVDFLGFHLTRPMAPTDNVTFFLTHNHGSNRTIASTSELEIIQLPYGRVLS